MRLNSHLDRFTGVPGRLGHLSSCIKNGYDAHKKKSHTPASLIELLSIRLPSYKRKGLPNVNTQGTESLEALSDCHQYLTADES